MTVIPIYFMGDWQPFQPLRETMSTDARVIPGIVKNGVVVPQANSDLPDGAHVNIVLQAAEMPLELREELEAWQRAGDQVWHMIDQWESEAH
jgi:hypothetical protein